MTDRPVHLVVMGVAGTGKTTVGEGVAERFDLPFAEGDAFHSAVNKAKMGAGHPLTDEDRWPWLRSLRDWMSDQAARGQSTVVACSALRVAYRDVLREADGDVFFLHLVLPEQINEERMTARPGHYMKTGMLDSQLSTLEPLEEREDGAEVPNVGEPAQVVADASLAAQGRFPGRFTA